LPCPSAYIPVAVQRIYGLEDAMTILCYRDRPLWRPDLAWQQRQSRHGNVMLPRCWIRTEQLPCRIYERVAVAVGPAQFVRLKKRYSRSSPDNGARCACELRTGARNGSRGRRRVSPLRRLISFGAAVGQAPFRGLDAGSAERNRSHEQAGTSTFLSSPAGLRSPSNHQSRSVVFRAHCC
jgi:hypothetical protein